METMFTSVYKPLDWNYFTICRIKIQMICLKIKTMQQDVSIFSGADVKQWQIWLSELINLDK